MPAMNEVLEWRGQTMVGSGGDKIGKIEEMYIDAQTEQPEWALVHTGLFGSASSFVPIAEATVQGSDVQVPFDKAQIKGAPKVEPDGALTEQDEAALYAHYGMDYGDSRSASGLPEGSAATTRGSAGTDVSGPETDDAMTRSEEELRVGTTPRETGRARLRKYVVEEQVTQTVPVRREEVRVEREPITDANAGAAMSGPDLSEEEHEVTLSEEEVVVEKRTVPKERVRMDKDVTTEQRQVSETVRKEQVDVRDAAGRPEQGHDGVRDTDDGIDR
jgi:uncharacterized protein (TIGR02271 family)